MSRKPAASSPPPDRSGNRATRRLDALIAKVRVGRKPWGAAMTAYDNNNVFAKILRGEFPCYKVYEDDHVLAFLDIMPRVPGHTLIIPKAPARNILDIKVDDYLHVSRATHKIAAAAMKAYGADGITVQQFNETAGGQVVFHLHVHVM